MTPEDQARLEACAAEIAEMLYRTSDPELDSLDGIEHTVRQQMLEEVSSRCALFLSTSKFYQPASVSGARTLPLKMHIGSSITKLKRIPAMIWAIANVIFLLTKQDIHKSDLKF
ncbi:MAG: hypothetical protein AAF327_07180 [Cyanobacteria bacterium P01_A01_bin.37]